MPYTKKDILWLISLNKENIEVLVDCGDSFQWLMLSDGILETNSSVFDHRFKGSEMSAYNLNWADKPYETIGETLI